MSGQITWRNVDQRPSTAEAALMFRSASTQMNQGIDTFAGLIKSAEATDASNVKARDEIGKQNYLDVLQGAKTPEQLAALAADPATAAARDSLSAASRAATRGALDARTTSLRADETAALAFDNARKEVAEKPFKAELAALTLTNPAAAQVRAQQYVTEGKIRDAAPFLKEAIATGRANTAYDQKEEAYQHALGNRPLQDQALQDQAAAAKLTAASLQRNEADRVSEQNAVLPAFREFENQKVEFNNKVKAIGTQLGIKPDDNGMPDTAAMSVDQLKAFGAALKAQKLESPPTSSAALEGIKQKMIANGSSITAIRNAMKGAEPVLKGDTALSPEDQANVDNQVAGIDKRLEMVKSDNLFYNPPAETNGLKTKVYEDADKLVTDNPATKTRLRAYLSKWMDEGIDIVGEDGTVTKVPVPPKLAASAMRAGLESDTWFLNQTAGYTEDNIRRMMTSKEYTQQRAEAVPFNTGQYLVDQRNIRRDAKRLSGAAAPADYLVSFNKRMDAELEKAKDAKKAAANAPAVKPKASTIKTDYNPIEPWPTN